MMSGSISISALPVTFIVRVFKFVLSLIFLVVLQLAIARPAAKSKLVVVIDFMLDFFIVFKI